MYIMIYSLADLDRVYLLLPVIVTCTAKGHNYLTYFF